MTRVIVPGTTLAGEGILRRPRSRAAVEDCEAEVSHGRSWREAVDGQQNSEGERLDRPEEDSAVEMDWRREHDEEEGASGRDRTTRQQFREQDDIRQRDDDAVVLSSDQPEGAAQLYGVEVESGQQVVEVETWDEGTQDGGTERVRIRRGGGRGCGAERDGGMAEATVTEQGDEYSGALGCARSMTRLRTRGRKVDVRMRASESENDNTWVRTEDVENGGESVNDYEHHQRLRCGEEAIAVMVVTAG